MYEHTFTSDANSHETLRGCFCHSLPVFVLILPDILKLHCYCYYYYFMLITVPSCPYLSWCGILFKEMNKINVENTTILEKHANIE